MIAKLLTLLEMRQTLIFNAYATLLHEMTHCLSSLFVLTFMHSHSESALAITGQNLSIIQQLQLNFTIISASRGPSATAELLVLISGRYTKGNL